MTLSIIKKAEELSKSKTQIRKEQRRSKNEILYERQMWRILDSKKSGIQKIEELGRLAKMLEGITEKGLHVQYADEFLSGINPSQVKSIQTVYQKYGRSGIHYWVKEAYSSLTDDEADSVAREVVRRVTNQATSNWRGE